MAPRYLQKPLEPVILNRQEKKAAERDEWVKKHLAETRKGDEEKRLRLQALRTGKAAS